MVYKGGKLLSKIRRKKEKRIERKKRIIETIRSWSMAIERKSAKKKENIHTLEEKQKEKRIK
jgi:hypothetical protein